MIRRHYFYLAIFLLSLLGCTNKEEQERLKWRVTLDPQDKQPYGAYLAANLLSYSFPKAALEPLSKGFRYDDIDGKLKRTDNDSPALIVFCGLDFQLSEEEWNNLKQFANEGNELMIFCSSLDEKIEKDLSCYKEPGDEVPMGFGNLPPDFNNMNVLSIAGAQDKRYGYHGRSLKGFFAVEIDSANIVHETNTSPDDSYSGVKFHAPDTLGFTGKMPDMLRYPVGGGHITLHAAPMALSNYFLLQPGNLDYFTAILHTLPKNISKVYTHHYYKRSASKSDLSILWKFPATKWALLLGIFALLMYVLFEGKRKQRIIPIVAPLKNDSVSFVETVGRLYYNKGDHTNLAEKMIQQFMEWVRTHYFLNTNLLNETFVQQLTIKSGQPEVTVRELLDMIHEIRLRSVKIDDPYLYKLYNTIQQFYKNHSK